QFRATQVFFGGIGFPQRYVALAGQPPPEVDFIADACRHRVRAAAVAAVVQRALESSAAAGVQRGEQRGAGAVGGELRAPHADGGGGQVVVGVQRLIDKLVQRGVVEAAPPGAGGRQRRRFGGGGGPLRRD